jgi:hypothetical protein
MIFRSPYPDVEIPEQSLPSFVLERASELADPAALLWSQIWKRPVASAPAASSSRATA